jgi:catechol 2,3-dioxygenase-like lactoylglutathione lyase family enzyme
MAGLKLLGLDHVVLTVKDLEVTVDFYTRVLGMRVSVSPGGPLAVRFGNQKINLHELGSEFQPNARRAVPGAGDLCLITEQPIEAVVSHLEECEVEILEGPVARMGALGPMTSVYFRDPDGNLLEVAAY